MSKHLKQKQTNEMERNSSPKPPSIKVTRKGIFSLENVKINHLFQSIDREEKGELGVELGGRDCNLGINV